MKRTHAEWVAYFRGIGMDSGMIWHMMEGLHALGLVLPNGERS
jgi:hypothetical protein